MRVILLVLALAFSGCLQGGDSTNDKSPGAGSGTDPGEPGEPGNPGNGTPSTGNELVPMLIDYHFTDCSGYQGYWRIATNTAEAELPDGYTPTSDPDPNGAAVARYVWMKCEQFNNPTAVVNDTVFGWVGVEIEAPEDAPEADEHWYLLRMIVQDDIMRNLWDAAGYDVAVGMYSTSFVGVSGSPSIGATTVGIAGYESTIVTQQGAEGSAASMAMYTETSEGKLTWITNFDPGTANPGQGSFAVGSGDPFEGQDWTGRTMSADQALHVASHWRDNNLWLELNEQ